MDESSDPSIERRRREYIGTHVPLTLSTGTSRDPSDLRNLSDFIDLMVEAGIDGPYEQSEVHFCGKHLGSGAQFDAYGHQHAAHRTVPPFDQPFVSTKSSRGKNIRPVVVAIKRPRLASSVSSKPPSLNMTFATRSQLQAIELEVRALCNSTIRQHRNIVKLIAWGLEHPKNVSRDQDQGIHPVIPLLVLEHGNCSIHEFLASNGGPIPRQVLQSLSLDAAQGLSALHASGIVHGDLKTDNVLVFPDEEGPFFCVAKLSDFGLSVFDQKETVYDIGTPGWQAPELPSDEGISAEMLLKSDFFSLGLLIFSILLTQGAPPLKGFNEPALELARNILMRSQIPPLVSSRISSVFKCLLQHNPFERVSDLEDVCRLLEVEESFHGSKAWINGRFDDNTPWGLLSLPEVDQTMMIIGNQTRWNYKNGHLAGDVVFESFYSWQEIYRFLCKLRSHEYDVIPEYYITGIDQIVSSRTPEENLSMEVVGKELTGDQLLALCFSDRIRSTLIIPEVARRIIGTSVAVAATKGHFPSQAVALQLLEETASKFLKKALLNDKQWQWNAVSTGYVLAWKFAEEYPEEYALALEHFRKSGGYNTHYIHTENKKNLSYDPSGLSRSPLEWLSTYPLHRAAVLEDISEMERLLKDQAHNVNSFDRGGETPLHRACMAGACRSVRFLIEHGADPAAKSKRLGTVPLHWLFVFEPKEIHDIAILLMAKNKSVLDELSAPEAETFHFPFKWPTGTPLEWAVLSNRDEAVNCLLELGSNLDSIRDFFPAPPSWLEIINAPTNTPWADDPTRKLWRVWIYYSRGQFRIPIVKNSLTYEKQLRTLSGQHGAPQAEPGPGSKLSKAVAENDFDAAKKLIDMGENVNHVFEEKSKTLTPLRIAISEKNIAIVQLLLDNGAKFDNDYPAPIKPLRIAVAIRHFQISKMLLDRGAEVNALSGGGPGPEWNSYPLGTALYEAAKRGSTRIFKLLLQYGADPSPQSEYEMNILEAAANANSIEIVELLLERKVDPNTPGTDSPNYQSALQAAARSNNVGIVRTLLDKGANPNLERGTHGTALQAALDPYGITQSELVATIKLLLERGADVTVSGGKFGSIMQAAACTYDNIVPKILLDAGAPVNIGGGPHGSALQAAISIGNSELAQLLLDHGADPDRGGGGEWKTPLQEAIHREDEKQVELLLKRGADPGAPGGPDGNAFKMAEKSRNAKIIQLLLDRGAQDGHRSHQPTSHSLITKAPTIEPEQTPIKAQPSPSKAPRIPEKDPEPTPIKPKASPPEILESMEQPPSQRETETATDGISISEKPTTTKKNGVFGKLISSLACCFK